MTMACLICKADVGIKTCWLFLCYALTYELFISKFFCELSTHH